MRKARIVLAAMIAGALLAGCAGRGGSTVSFSPEESSIFVARDGSVSSALVESYDNDYYDQAELKASIEEAVASFNEEQGRTAVTLSSCTLGNGRAIALFEYGNAADLCAFPGATQGTSNQVESLLVSTVKEGLSAKNAGDVLWRKAKDGSEVPEKTVQKKGDLHLVMLTGQAVIQTEGNIRYYSGQVSLTDEHTAVVNGGQAYLAFQ